jgi:hypothetical protein
MNPFGAVFTPGKSFSGSQDFGSGSSSTFFTPSKGSAMKFLNMGSTPEGPSSKASSLSPVKPIGSGFSSPSRQPVLRDGPPFSTDADPNVAESRFVRFGMIPMEWLADGTLVEVLHGVGFPRFCHNYVLTLLIDWSRRLNRQLCSFSGRYPCPRVPVCSLRRPTCCFRIKGHVRECSYHCHFLLCGSPRVLRCRHHPSSCSVCLRLRRPG